MGAVTPGEPLGTLHFASALIKQSNRTPSATALPRWVARLVRFAVAAERGARWSNPFGQMKVQRGLRKPMRAPGRARAPMARIRVVILGVLHVAASSLQHSCAHMDDVTEGERERERERGGEGEGEGQGAGEKERGCTAKSLLGERA